jgi:hypothetical protein
VFTVATTSDGELQPLLNGLLEQAEPQLPQRRKRDVVARKILPQTPPEHTEPTSATVTLWEQQVDQLFALTAVADADQFDF